MTTPHDDGETLKGVGDCGCCNICGKTRGYGIHFFRLCEPCAERYKPWSDEYARRVSNMLATAPKSDDIASAKRALASATNESERKLAIEFCRERAYNGGRLLDVADAIAAAKRAIERTHDPRDARIASLESEVARLKAPGRGGEEPAIDLPRAVLDELFHHLGHPNHMISALRLREDSTIIRPLLLAAKAFIDRAPDEAKPSEREIALEASVPAVLKSNVALSAEVERLKGELDKERASQLREYMADLVKASVPCSPLASRVECVLAEFLESLQPAPPKPEQKDDDVCPRCKGTRTVDSDKFGPANCPACRGSGHKTTTTHVEVRDAKGSATAGPAETTAAGGRPDSAVGSEEEQQNARLEFAEMLVAKKRFGETPSLHDTFEICRQVVAYLRAERDGRRAT